MKKLLLAVFSMALFLAVDAQNKDEKKKNDWSKIDLSNRANDHFMIQYGYDGWANTPDSINPSGFSRHFNFYFMYDKPFKTNPHYSIGIGIGLGSSNIFFKDTYIDLKSLSARLPFKNVTNENHFDKYKLTTMFGEAPLEFRYTADPITPDKGFKASVGMKFGMLMKSYTKGKNLVSSSGATLYGKNYIAKEQEKHYFNTTRIAATARVGYGFISLDGSYQFTRVLKDGAGPVFNPWSVGLTISGL